VKLAVLEALVAARAERRPVALVTDLESGEQRLVDAEDELARTALRSDRCETVGSLFVQPHNPPLELFVVGAVHIAQALVPMARLAGYDVTVIDPRTAFASPERFPGVRIDDRWPDEAMEALGVTSRTAIVALTHDPKIDDPALTFAIASPAFYVGALGSRKSHGKRLSRLREAGAHEEALDRIFGPIGLPLGGRAPAEIAISILAQMTAVLRSPKPAREAARDAMPRRFAAVVLAAGLSRRMGDANKLLAPIAGTPMVTHVVRAAEAAGLREVVVVTGHDEAAIRAALGGSAARFVHNPDFAAGMSTSLRAGVRALGPHVDGALVLLGDMPWVTPAHLAALTGSFAPEEGASICVPLHEGQRGNPVLWGSRYFAELASLSGDVGARALLDTHAREVRFVAVPDPGVLRDVDTPDAIGECENVQNKEPKV
jgi:CTP:molybdopterin cytidylyltransferase MocA/xanthine/CO dehydrogenase XdhC/CoxF family maturation factor